MTDRQLRDDDPTLDGADWNQNQYNGLGFTTAQPGTTVLELTDVVSRTLVPRVAVLTLTMRGAPLEKGLKNMWLIVDQKRIQVPLRKNVAFGDGGRHWEVALPTVLVRPGQRVTLRLELAEVSSTTVLASGGLVCDERNPKA